MVLLCILVYGLRLRAFNIFYNMVHFSATVSSTNGYRSLYDKQTSVLWV